jgi:hypothetical protein
MVGEKRSQTFFRLLAAVGCDTCPVQEFEGMAHGDLRIEHRFGAKIDVHYPCNTVDGGISDAPCSATASRRDIDGALENAPIVFDHGPRICVLQ